MQRDQIDAESKSAIRDLNAGISQLESFEKLRQNTEKQLADKKRASNGLGALGRWAAGGVSGKLKLSPEEQLEEAQRKAIKDHRESVIWYLRRNLAETSETHSSMVETRLEREMEKSKSMLYKTTGYKSVDLGRKEGVNGFANGGPGGLKSPGVSTEAKTALDEKTRLEAESTLTPEQLQIFAKENNDMLNHFEDQLSEIRYVFLWYSPDL